MFFRLLRINPDGRTRFVRFRKEASIHSGSETVNAGGVYGSLIPFFLSARDGTKPIPPCC